MPAHLYGDVWREVRLSVPGAPVFLARKWVDDAYRTLCDRRPWQWLQYTDQIVWLASRTFSCTVTLGSTSVTAVAGTFVSTDVGRQFRVGTFPIYTIIAVLPDGTRADLDLAYQSSAGGGVKTGQILDAYCTLPTKFGSFLVLADQVNQRFVPWWASLEELALLDPTRTSADSVPRLLAAASPSPVPATLGQTRYEFWPKPSAAGSFFYYARSRPEIPSDQTALTGVLATRPDVLEAGALAAAARWPGTKDLPNPYFNLALARQLQQDFDAGCLQLDLRDDDQVQQTYSTLPWHLWTGWGWAYDTHLLQMTDATLGDYFGGGTYSLGW